MIRKPVLVASTLILSCLLALPASAQTLFEDGELAGWTTEASIEGLTVSGSRGPAGGSPGAHYLLRHQHRNDAPFSPNVTTVNLSGQEVPAAALASTVRFEADLRFEVDPEFRPQIQPTLHWLPALEQAGVLFTAPPPQQILFRDRYVPVAMSDIGPGDWGGVDLSPDAPPVRFGLVLQTVVLAPFPDAVEARIRIDNVRVLGGPSGPARVDLVALPSPAGEPVVFAPEDCFDGEPDEFTKTFDVWADLDRSLPEEVCIDIGGPALAPDTPQQPCARIPPGAEFGAMALRCRAQPPSSVALGTLPEGLVPGTPASARVLPCVLRVGDTLQSCETVDDLCAAEAFFEQLCRAGNVDLCNPPLLAVQAPATPRREPWRAGHGAAQHHPLDTLRELRDGPMSESPAGRYYRDLYAAFSPELRSILLADLRIPVDLFGVVPLWLGGLRALNDGRGDEVTMTSDMVAGLLRVLDRFDQAEDASAPLRVVIAREKQRLGLGDLAGESLDALVERVEAQGGPPACGTSDTTLCLQGGRFLVEAHWTDFEGSSGVGRAVPLPSGSGQPDSGYFWFFDDANVELVVKVLDGRTVNGEFWVFYGALSNVEYTLVVTDTETGAVRAYRNPAGELASVGDTAAFSPDGAPRGAEGALADGSSDPSLLRRLATAAADTVRGAWERLNGGWRGHEASPLRSATLGSTGVTSRPRPVQTCAESPTALCLQGGRFRVEVEWRDFEGTTGAGQARALTGDTGTFWFFDPSNTELIVKVLDGRAINDHFWVFYGALSNVAYTIRVTDTETGTVRTYENPAGELGSRGDTEAF